MDVASPLIEYVNSGRRMSMDEIAEIIKVVRSADKYKADADRLAEALKELVSIVKIYSENMDDNFAWAEMPQARAALAEHEAQS